MFDKDNPKPGAYNISNEDYHSSSGVSRSQLMRLKISPLHFWYFNLNPMAIEKADTKALIFGSAFHTYILEPDDFDARYLVATKPSGTGMKAEKARILKEAGNKIVLWGDEYDNLVLMGDAIRANPQMKPLLEQKLLVEQAIYWNEPETGLLVKCKPDGIGENMVIDVKTTKDASFYKFRSDAYLKGYHIQAAMIKEAMKIVFDIDLSVFMLLAHEKVPPFVNVPYPLADEFLERGMNDYKELMRKLAECTEKNQWPGYEPDLLTLPNYAKGNYE